MSEPRRRAVLKRLGAVPLAASLPASRAETAGLKTLRVSIDVAETGFDPAQINDLYSRQVTAHIFDGLYAYDYLARPYKIKPNVADAMPQVADDFRTWIVRLMPGIRFADDAAFNGKPRELVAADFVYSFKRFFDPRIKSPTVATLAEQRFVGMEALRKRAFDEKKPFDYDTPIDGVRALDRYTLQFRLEEPRPRFLQLLAGGDLYGAVAREVVEAYGDAIAAHPVGTGPFRLADWRRSSRVVLERNPGYRERYYDAEPNDDDTEGQAIARRFRGRRLPMVDRIEIAVIEENQPRWLAFLNAEQDVLERLPYEFADLAIPNSRLAPNLARRRVQMYRMVNSDVYFTLFNAEHPVIGGYTPERIALRRALCLALDIDQEIRLFWHGQAIPAQSPLMPNTNGYDPAFHCEGGEHDVARAKALLDMFGYVDRNDDGWREQPDGAPLVLEWMTTPDQRARQRDELRRKDMASIGIKVDFRAAKWPENLKNARAGKVMVWNVGLSAASPDGHPSLARGASEHVGGQNMARFRNAKFDDLFHRIGNLPDGPEREALFAEAKRILAVYAPYKNQVHRILTDLAHPWLQGYRRSPYWYNWWQYVDIDVAAKSAKTSTTT